MRIRHSAATLHTLVAATALVVTLAGNTEAQSTATLRGRVTDSLGTPMRGASIVIDGTTHRATSGTAGTYEIRGIAAGTYLARVRLIGFTPAVQQVALAAGQTIERDFTLRRSPIQLSPVDVVVGSRARHTAAEELAVPVDIYPAELLQRQGTTETSQILQAVAPSINFPRQSVTDANDVVRPFTLRGLSPDHTLVLLNGWRRHQTALVNNFTYGMGAGSSGVDLNALPASSLERIEVLRDGASAQYGSDAIAGVVNLVLREGSFSPFLNASAGQYMSADYPDDGRAVTVNGGWGVGVGRGSLALFAEVLDRQATNRAWADVYESAGTGLTDSVDSRGQVVVKRNPVPQPNHHWGDGEQQDVMTFANFRMPLGVAAATELYSFGGYSFRRGTGNGYRRYFDSGRNWPQIHPLGFLPQFSPEVRDYSAVGGVRGARGDWSFDLGASFGHDGFEYHLENTLNASLGPCLQTACAPGADGILGNADDPGIPNKTAFFAGAVERDELIASAGATRVVRLSGRAPLNLAFGASFRRESYGITRGETASWINGGHPNQDGSGPAPAGSQVFPGFRPSDETDASRTNFGAYADAETNLTDQVLASAAARFESYSDFGQQLTGKLALRVQPTQRVTLRAAASTGFRAPGLSQAYFSKITTNVIGGVFKDIGIFPVGHAAARLLGSRPLREETSRNLSAGIALSPRDNVTITADWFDIRIDDRILLSATFDDDTTVAILGRGGFGDVAGVQYFTNGLDTKTTGVDVASSVRWPAGRAGSMTLTADMNWARNSISRIDPLPSPLARSSEPGLIDSVTYIGITEERPDWRGTLALDYTSSRLRALGRASYYGAFSSAQPGFCDLCRERYGAKTLFDAEAGYRFARLTWSVGVRNLFDTYPDSPSSRVVVDPSSGDRAMDYNNNYGTFPWAAASPFGYNGRYVYTRAEVQLGW